MTGASVRLTSRIPAGATLFIDTSVVIAYLAGDERDSPQATQLFDSFVATGRNPASISVVTAGEILVRPYQRGAAAVANAEGFLRHFDGMVVVDTTFAVAREAARIRALTSLRTPDALILASAVLTGADVLVTSDHFLSVAASRVAPDLAIHGLSSV